MPTATLTCTKSLFVFNLGDPTGQTRLDVRAIGPATNDFRRSIISFGSLAAYAGSRINSAVLTLTKDNVNSNYNTALAVSCHPMTRFTWTESGGWTNYDASNPWTTPGGDFQASTGVTTGLAIPTSGTPATQTYTITSTIQHLLDTSPLTCDFILKITDETQTADAVAAVVFDHRTDGVTGPVLDLDYTPGAGDGRRYIGFARRLRGREVR